MASDIFKSNRISHGRDAHVTHRVLGPLMILAALGVYSVIASAQETRPADSPAAYRTDSANPRLAWYRLKPGEFPPIGSEHRVRGELLAADFIHRIGQFRSEETHTLVNFTMLPYSLVYCLNTEADLRDIPLGTRLQFYLYQDEKRDFTKAVVIRDETPAEKNDADKIAGEQQRKKHVAFLKQRGLAARIDRVEGKKLVVTLFGDPAGLRALCKDEGIVPEQWARHYVKVAVANEELRTYDPHNDNKEAEVLEFHQLPTDRHGCSGIQWTIEPGLLLEGFRKGRIIRIFAQNFWPVEDMPFGETLYTERPGAKVEEEALNQYPYRTDFGNEELPWYQLKPGEFAPWQSQHVVSGELRKVDAGRRSGQFRADGSGELVDFTMPPCGSILYLNADAELSDLPLGRRYQFYLYQDGKGSFTKAVVVMDEFTRLSDEKLTCRIENVNLKEGKIFLADQLAPMKDDKDHLVQPPDLGHGEFGVDNATRIWKGDKQAMLSDIAAGDTLLVNLSGRTGAGISRVTDIWDGPDAQKRADDEQREKHKTLIKHNGMPGWIERVDGKTITVTFFAGIRKDFQDIKQGEPWGQSVLVKLADDNLRPLDDPTETMGLKGNTWEQNPAGTYGSAGVRWVLESGQLPDSYRQGRVVRVFKQDWTH